MNIPTITRTLSLEGHTLKLDVPADPELVLEQAVAGEESGDRFSDPYWGLVWEAAPATARRILKQTWPADWNVLELGCGVGVAGIAALMAGMQVMFSDLVPAAVNLAVRNAAANGFTSAQGMVLDWNAPQPSQFQLLLASDVLYDAGNHRPLLNVLNSMLAKGGLVWIGDAGRHNAPRFIQLARELGWTVTLSDEHGQPQSEPSLVRFQLLELTR
jgi:predicted nicotinamide N-methyase